jgi:transcriptional regulator with XRE-family HTH domain
MCAVVKLRLDISTVLMHCESMSKSDTNFIIKNLSRAIVRRRLEIGISQEELARRAGISRGYCSDIERGLRNISVGLLFTIAEALNSNTPDLLQQAGLSGGAAGEAKSESALQMQDDGRDGHG